MVPGRRGARVGGRVETHGKRCFHCAAEHVDGGEMCLLDGGGVAGETDDVVAGHGERVGRGPVSAQAVAPTAHSRLGLRPLVDSRTRMSPGRPCACTWRAKTSS